MLASVGVACSFDAPHGSHAGSYGSGVASMTRQAFRLSREVLGAAGRRNPELQPVVDALAALVRVDAPNHEDVARLEAIIRQVEGG